MVRSWCDREHSWYGVGVIPQSHSMWFLCTLYSGYSFGGFFPFCLSSMTNLRSWCNLVKWPYGVKKISIKWLLPVKVTLEVIKGHPKVFWWSSNEDPLKWEKKICRASSLLLRIKWAYYHLSVRMVGLYLLIDECVKGGGGGVECKAALINRVKLTTEYFIVYCGRILKQYCPIGSAWPRIDLIEICPWLLLFKYWTGGPDLTWTLLSVPITCISSETHRMPTPFPLPLLVAKAGRNHLNEEITPLLLTGIIERYSQTVTNMCQAALTKMLN